MRHSTVLERPAKYVVGRYERQWLELQPKEEQAKAKRENDAFDNKRLLGKTYMGLFVEMTSIAMCKKPRPVHVADWHVVKRINIFLISTKLGAEVVVVTHLRELKIVVKGKWFEVRARIVVSRVGVAGETVGHSNDTVGSKSFRWGRTIGDEHALLEAMHIFETQRIIDAQKTEMSLGIDPHVVVISITQHSTEPSLMVVQHNIVFIIPWQSRNLAELS